MASTRTIQDVARWAGTFTKLQPIIGVGGYQAEPALTIGNNVLQEMITAPFNWPFNSVDAPPFLTTYCTDNSCQNVQDYLQSITDIQWIESATYTENLSTAQPKPIDIVRVVQNIQKTNLLGPPSKLCKRQETDQGIIIRLWPVPTKITQWQIDFTYQKKAPVKQGIQDTWSPFPDELAFVYNQGFLAMAYKQADDPRWLQEYLKFQALMRQALSIEDMEEEGYGFSPLDSMLLG